MTPDRRLDQLEPVVAEVLQNTDRLVEGQGRLVNLTTKTQADVDQIKTDVSQVRTDVEQVRTDVGQVKADVEQVRADVEQVKADVGQVKATGEITATGLAKLTVNVQQGFLDVRQDLAQIDAKTDERIDRLRTEMNQRFDQLINVIQERLK